MKKHEKIVSTSGKSHSAERGFEPNRQEADTWQAAARLLGLMTQLPDDLLEEAAVYEKPVAKTVSRNKGALVAACLSVFLIGGLAWDWLYDELEQTKTTAAVETQGGVQGQTLASTKASTMAPTGAEEAMVAEFWYDGQWYVASGFHLTELPDSCVYQETLHGDETTDETQTILIMENWLTRAPALAGAKVYRMAGDDMGFYVETESGYGYYAAEAACESLGQTEGYQ